jgi:hypothetical protein
MVMAMAIRTLPEIVGAIIMVKTLRTVVRETVATEKVGIITREETRNE